MATTAQATAGGKPAGLALLRFRGDIQGLRAVAVLLVLVYHAQWPVFGGGGFVGVDVFFVISGFLITGLLMREFARSGRISLLNFYARRVQRILPAALVVIVLTLLAGWRFFPLARHPELGWAGMWSALSVGNWYFALESTDYFHTSAPSPLQHYWSLGVEEQFYLVWPVLIIATLSLLASKLGRRASAGESRVALSEHQIARVVLVFAMVLGLPSLIHSIIYSGQNPGAAYFVTTTRVWELALGAAAASWVVLGRATTQTKSATMGWIGLGLVLAGALCIDGGMAFPGWLAAVPVVGATLVVLAGVHAAEGSGFGPHRLLDNAPMRWIGDLSYSLYLVHWPLLAIVANGEPAGLRWWQQLCLPIVSVILAWGLRRFVELPAMRARRAPAAAIRAGALGVSLVAALCVGAVFLAAQRIEGLLRSDEDDQPLGALATVADDGSAVDPMATLGDVTRIVPDPSVAGEDKSPFVKDGCQVSAAQSEVKLCHYGSDDATVTVALVGDSHAAHWGAALIAAAEEHDWALVTAVKGSCPVVEGMVWLNQSNAAPQPFEACKQWNEGLSEALSTIDPDLILVSSAPYEMVDGSSTAEAMASSWRELDQHGWPVAVLLDPPRATMSIPQCLVEHSGAPETCAFQREEGLRLSATPTLRSAIELAPSVETIDLTDRMCPGPTCAPVVGDVVLLHDSNHLTATFSRTLGEPLGARVSDLLRP